MYINSNDAGCIWNLTDKWFNASFAYETVLYYSPYETNYRSIIVEHYPGFSSVKLGIRNVKFII